MSEPNVIALRALEALEAHRHELIRFYDPALYPECARVLAIFNTAFEDVRKDAPLGLPKEKPSCQPSL